IKLRKRFNVFGRGSIQFLHPRNRHVLAYIRQDANDVILIVANLSRFAQPVELDLAEFRGASPVELIGNAEFPAISDRPYFLSLGPHAFYWFRLQQSAPPERIQFDEPPTKVTVPQVGSNYDALFGRSNIHTLERNLLPAFLARQTWFA